MNYLEDLAEIDAEVARMRAKFPKIFTSPLPNPPDTDSQKGGGDSIYVNSISKDEE